MDYCPALGEVDHVQQGEARDQQVEDGPPDRELALLEEGRPPLRVDLLVLGGDGLELLLDVIDLRTNVYERAEDPRYSSEKRQQQIIQILEMIFETL